MFQEIVPRNEWMILINVLVALWTRMYVDHGVLATMNIEETTRVVSVTFYVSDDVVVT